MERTKLVSGVNLVVTLAALVALTVETRTTFILPPFIATAATKFEDPQWRFNRTISVVSSYVLSGVLAVVTVAIGGRGILWASVVTAVAWILMILADLEHSPALLAAFLGVLERVGPLYVLHPVLVGCLLEESIHFVTTKGLSRGT
ncbi:HPP family protein [Sulfodiicoccus acidiphilus]|uniref:HPP family protein n=2 Tax=Sulfodiicoccus acidiphilus TaxID=1670455 RepID=A0A348B1W8_9CREN|nr:HPP family protein [Sulfodiicoccus acidiphilus]GGT94493.1 HPP family protein [Sulfodiicoccus acidiphilus]